MAPRAYQKKLAGYAPGFYISPYLKFVGCLPSYWPLKIKFYPTFYHV